ncbi:hypothetical protein AMTRI_Chr12g274590 [Amborella trichopoda]
MESKAPVSNPRERHGPRSVVPIEPDTILSSQFPESLIEREDPFFSSKVLKREPSKAFSSRVYYRAPGTVPFNWETHPGKPKISLENDIAWPEDDILPPLSPPPKLQSLERRTCQSHQHVNKSRLGIFRLGKRRVCDPVKEACVVKEFESWGSSSQSGSSESSFFGSEPHEIGHVGGLEETCVVRSCVRLNLSSIFSKVVRRSK